MLLTDGVLDRSRGEDLGQELRKHVGGIAAAGCGPACCLAAAAEGGRAGDQLEGWRVYAAVGPGCEPSARLLFTAGCLQPPLSPNPRTGAP